MVEPEGSGSTAQDVFELRSLRSRDQVGVRESRLRPLRKMVVEEVETGLELVDDVPVGRALLDLDDEQSNLTPPARCCGEIAHLRRPGGIRQAAVVGVLDVEPQAEPATVVRAESNVEATPRLAERRSSVWPSSGGHQRVVEGTDRTPDLVAQGRAGRSGLLPHRCEGVRSTRR